MNNERFNELIDDAYKNYSKQIIANNLHLLPASDLPSTQEEFINKIKTDDEFADKWGLKIEERELSLRERGDIFKIIYPDKSVDDFAPSGMEVQSLSHQLNTRYNNAKIPTRAISITYNNETIEIYE